MTFTDEDRMEADLFISQKHPSIIGHILETFITLKNLYELIDFKKLDDLKSRTERKRGACFPLEMIVIGEFGVERKITVNYDRTVASASTFLDIDNKYERGEWAKFDGKELVYKEDIVRINPLNSKNPLFLASRTYEFDGIKPAGPKIINYTERGRQIASTLDLCKNN